MNDDSGSAFLKHFNSCAPDSLEWATAKKILDHPTQLMPPPTDEETWEEYNLETLKHVLVLLFPQDVHSRTRLFALVVVQMAGNAAFVRDLSLQTKKGANEVW